ncbi:T9SS type A sorting domain-containing protein [Pontibacter sp. H249]|uniref:T9SS type A sorting domain-containing protein n=1 Tax=Pontibacter sp. H249 TaxID=3133420 RepID=UPI0030BDA7A1
MNKFYFLLLPLILLIVAAQAQTTVYYENFNVGMTGVMSNVVSGKATWETADDAASSTLAMSSKGRYIRTVNSVAGTKTLILMNAISTKGLSSAFITWQEFRSPRKKNFDLTEAVRAYYSTDGGTTRQLFFTTSSTVNNLWGHVNSGTPIRLPQAALGSSNLRIEIEINFSKDNGDKDPYYAIDDVSITGELIEGYSTFSWADRPLDENPFLVSGPTSTNPYTVDGVAMRWSASMGSNVSFEAAKVDDKTHKAGKRTFTLIQNGATPTVGSIINLNLSKPVSDLSFTLFDVDVATNQFKDKINVVGYNKGVPVQLEKSKVKTTSYNQFTEGTPGIISGITASDNTSGEGDVAITFSQPVDRVMIEYLNDSQNRSNNGRQGIGIHNLSWRNEQPIQVLPVELASFKAQLLNSQSKLTWVTAMEKDNDKFIVERSLDGKVYRKIGEVKGRGNSSVTTTYGYTDTNPAAGINYYRLQQVDYSGKTSYSSVVTVDLSARATLVAQPVLYPTVASSEVSINLAGLGANVQIRILDATGKTIREMTASTAQEVVVPVHELKGGAYFVSVTDGERRETLRFVKR